ncbi:hypothetical protein BDR22DRAFT_850228 [Usnea florida]
MTQYLPQQAAAIPLIAALAANSQFLYGNTGVMTAGIIPYVLDQSSTETIKATNWFIEKGAIMFATTALASSALFGTAAYNTSELRVRQLSTVAAVSMFSILPWTVAFMLPINKSLAEMGSGGAKEVEEGKEGKAVEKVKMWRRRHTMRMVLGAIGWVAGVAALEIL